MRRNKVIGSSFRWDLIIFIVVDDMSGKPNCMQNLYCWQIVWGNVFNTADDIIPLCDELVWRIHVHGHHVSPPKAISDTIDVYVILKSSFIGNKRM